MNDKIIARRYAASFIESTSEYNIDESYGDFQAFVKAYYESEEVRYILSHPEISFLKKLDLITKLFKDKGHRLARNFICVLVKRQRINYLKKIEKEVRALYRKKKGIRDIVVKSAVPLNEKERIRLRALLEQKFGLLDINEEVDESIIGGLIISFEDQVLDESIQYRLKKLKELMTKIDNEWLAELIDQPGLAI